MRRALTGLLLAVAACKLEPVLDLDSIEPAELPERWFRERPEVERVDEEASLVEAELRRQMRLLTSPVLGGRRPGTEGAALTASHIERTMNEVGLSPAGIGGGWRQPVVVRIRNTDDAQLELPPAADAGEGAEPDVLRHGEGIVLWRGDEAGAWSEELAVVDAGYGIVAPDLGVDDYADRDVAGALVLVRSGVPTDVPFDAASARVNGSYETKFAKAHDAGAAGCLLATGALAAEDTWVELAGQFSQPRVDASGPDDGLPSTFAGLLSAEADAELRAWLDAARVDTPEGTLITPPRLRASVTTTERTIVDPNIVGRIPGETRPQEVVVVLAHWDAGGTGPTLPGGGAAIENATGVAALLATARKSTDWVRRGRSPDRSIAFVATASDSLDLAGTHALLTSGPLQRSVVVAIVVLDSLSVHAGGAALGMVGGDESALGDRLRVLRPSIRDVTLDEGAPVTSAHAPGLELKIPAVTLTRYDEDASAPDTYDPDGGVSDLRDDVSLIFDLVWGYAESEESPALRE